jgi:hypothetical protein
MSFSPSRHRARSPRFLATLTNVGLVIYAAACAWAIWTLYTGVGIVDDLQAGRDVSERYDEWSVSLEAFELKTFAFQLLGIVAFCLWTYRVTANVRSWGIPGASPAWAVGSHFVPLLNLWKPYAILARVWIASEPPAPRSGGRASHGAGLVLAWWLLWTGSRIGGSYASYAMRQAEELGAISSAMSTSIAMRVLELVALALLLAVVWGLTYRQEQRQAASGLRGTVFA